MIPDPALPHPDEIRLVGGSYRDPSGYVFKAGPRIFRTVNPSADAAFIILNDSGLLRDLCEASLMLPTSIVPMQPGIEKAFIGARGEVPALLLEHPLIPLITYPYEWCFSQLRDAALAHLDLQIMALDRGFVLSDATPYNIQFWKGRPVHIDVLSLRPYREGELWQGYNQFCRMFLAPLLLEAWSGVGFQPILRGRIDGLALDEASRLLGRRKLMTSMQGFLHIYLHGKAEARSSSSRMDEEAAPRSLPKSRYAALLGELRRFVAGLSSGKRSKSFWEDYAAINSYSDDMRTRKAGIIAEFVRRNAIGSMLDLGGNTGDYSRVALDAGAHSATVLDGDNDSIEVAYRRARTDSPGLAACMVDLTDPSPGMGWNGGEREKLTDRLSADGLIALAVIHHMCIGRNIPLQAAVRWLVSLAPRGIIEFVPKADAMVAQMLRGRDDVFHDYDIEHFASYLMEVATPVSRTGIDGSERVFFEYAR